MSGPRKKTEQETHPRSRIPVRKPISSRTAVIRPGSAKPAKEIKQPELKRSPSAPHVGKKAPSSKIPVLAQTAKAKPTAPERKRVSLPNPPRKITAKEEKKQSSSSAPPTPKSSTRQIARHFTPPRVGGEFAAFELEVEQGREVLDPKPERESKLDLSKLRVPEPDPMEEIMSILENNILPALNEYNNLQTNLDTLLNLRSLLKNYISSMEHLDYELERQVDKINLTGDHPESLLHLIDPFTEKEYKDKIYDEKKLHTRIQHVNDDITHLFTNLIVLFENISRQLNFRCEIDHEFKNNPLAQKSIRDNIDIVKRLVTTISERKEHTKDEQVKRQVDSVLEVIVQSTIDAIKPVDDDKGSPPRPKSR